MRINKLDILLLLGLPGKRKRCLCKEKKQLLEKLSPTDTMKKKRKLDPIFALPLVLGNWTKCFSFPSFSVKRGT